MTLDADAGGALAIEGDALRLGVGDDVEVLASLDRAQVGNSRGRTTPVAVGELVIADAFLSRAIEVVRERNARGHARFHERIAYRIVHVHVGDAERSAGAVQRVGAALLVLGALEIGQYVSK